MKRQRFLRKLRKLLPQYGSENIVYFDESGFKASTVRPYGWAPRGKQVHGNIPGKREKRTNLLMAQRKKRTSTGKWLAPFVFQGSCNAKVVETWIKKCLIKELNKPSLIIMDNAPFHNKKTIADILKKKGHRMLPLPPYSPDFNPIEKSFAALKKKRQGLPKNTTIENLVMSYQ